MAARKITVYKARDGWRWRIVGRNGKGMADSGEAYKRRTSCLKSAVAMLSDDDLRANAAAQLAAVSGKKE